MGVEIKRQDAPVVTRVLRIAMEDIGLEGAWILYPGTRTYALDDRITVRPLEALAAGPRISPFGATDSSGTGLGGRAR